MKLYVYSHKDFNDIMCEKKWFNSNDVPNNSACISICNTDAVDMYGLAEDLKEHWFDTSDGVYSNILNINFDDITALSDDSGCLGISESQAKRIVKFIVINYGKDFYIHCSAGKSRSQGIARFIIDCNVEIADYLGIELVEYETRFDNPCLTPNYFVVSTLKQIWRNIY